MKIKQLINRFTTPCCMMVVLGIAFAVATPAYAANTQEMHRLYNRYTGEHFYTANTTERDSLSKIGWTYEGVGWIAPTSSNTPVYRLYNRYVPGGDHHYTTSAKERDTLVAAGWTSEGTGWFSADSSGQPLYRQYNPYAQTGTHNYTADKNENDVLVSKGWRAEGVGWYGVKQGSGSNAGSNNNVGSSGSSNSNSNSTGGGNSQGSSGDGNHVSGGLNAGNANVVFETGEGTKIPTQHIRKGERATKPADPVWDGYEFLGWYGWDGKPYNFSKPVDVDQLMITAKWKQVYRYSYEVYYIDGLGDTWYTSIPRLLYIKTNNPTVDFDITIDGDASSAPRLMLNTNSIDDISASGTENGCLRVSGGYVMKIRLDTPKTGRVTLDLREPQSVSSIDVQPASPKQFAINVRNYEQAETEWIDQQIKRFTDSSTVTPVQKMKAICAGLKREFKYHPVDRETGYTVGLSTMPTSPYFITHMWDSKESPSAIAKIMKRVGFTNVRSCYNDYPMNSADWDKWHFYATGTYNGERHNFEACPSIDSNPIDLSSVGKIDFNNISQFQRVL